MLGEMMGATEDHQENGDSHRAEPQKLRLFVAHTGDADRHDQPVTLEVPGARLHSRPLDRTSLSNLNRLVRTRRLGGVGAGEGNLSGYPISGGLSCSLPPSRPTTPPLG